MFELREFFIEGGNHKKSHVLLHITEPSDTAEELAKGHFFALAEINNGSDAQIQLLQQMIDEIETGYYENDDGKEKDAFELTLEYTNRRGHLILEKQESNLHCLVGVFKNNKLSFSYHGRPSVKIIFRKNDRYQLLNILEKEAEPQTDNQLFSAIMQGQLRENDFFYLATPQVEKHLSRQQLLNTLPAHTTRQSAEYIQKILSSLRDGYSYGGIIFHLKPKLIKPSATKKPTAAPPAKNPAPDESTETNYRPHAEFASESMTNLILINFGRMLISILKTSFRLIKLTFLFLGKILLGIVILISNRGGGRALVWQSLLDNLAAKKQFIRRLPLASKILFWLTLCLAFAFAASVGYLNFKKTRLEKRQIYLNQVQAIEDKRAAAEGSMLYEDDAKAFTLLKGAESILNELYRNSKEERAKYEELKSALLESIKILQKINLVDAELLADLTTVQTSAQAVKLARLNDDLIAYGPNDLFSYKLNLNTGQIDKISHQTISGLSAANTPKEQDKIIFLTADNTLAQYSPVSGTITALALPLDEGTSLSNLFVYNQKIYSINTLGDQILRHSPTQLGFDKGAPWLKSESDLSDAVSLAIDGDLFLLKANGEIYKFVSGVKQEFAVTGLDPALSNPAEIWTYNNVKNIYVLEPTNRRVVVLDKQGQLLQQYTQASWQSPTGMVVDEEKKVIYILDDNKIYRFGIE